MPSEPSGSDISGFVDLPTSQQTQHRRIFHIPFDLVDLHACLPHPKCLSIINGSTQNRKAFEASARTCHNVAYASASWGVVIRSENPISLEM
ncbi:hypothetical protein ACN42_g8143 [Penicillium freii]|uniref:Uncharacterized protein n=1 Tax=Penicillium freii TaxID=48697 RepID=A0A124GQS0_PENFR|nr:hypothetical protein ACN42_g8143 [Penicillium freii]